MRIMNQESSSKAHLPGVKAHLEGGREKTVDNVRNAFTLAEILVVIAVTAIVGTIMVLIFTNTLRGSNKAQLLSVIKQNGQAVLENMDKTIRNSDDVVCVSNNPSNTLVVIKNGVYTRYRIALSNNGVNTAPASCIGPGKNGCIVQDNPTPPPLPQSPTQLCDPSQPMSAVPILTDTNTQSGVLIKSNSGFFTLSKPAGFKAVVTVNFILGPATGAPAVITGQIDPVAFQTTIELR